MVEKLRRTFQKQIVWRVSTPLRQSSCHFNDWFESYHVHVEVQACPVCAETGVSINSKDVPEQVGILLNP